MSEQFDLSTVVRRVAREAGRELLRALNTTVVDPEPPPAEATSVRTEMHRFQQCLERLSDSDLAIYRAALSGLEDTLMSADSFHYRSVLDQLLQNVGALLDELDCFALFGGEMPATTHDLGWADSVQARLDVIESLPFEQTRRRIRQTRLAPLFEGTMPALVKQRLYRPRFLRAPKPDERCYGLMGQDRYGSHSLLVVVTRALPDTPDAGQAEVPVLVRRTRLRDRLFSSLPAQQEVWRKLRPDDFAHLLQGLLLDTRAYCYRRAQDQQQLEHLNALLFQILVEAQEDVEHLRTPRGQ